MSPAPLVARRRGWVVLAAAVAIAALVLVLALQSSPVRRLVLRQAISTLESRTGIVLEADALQYGLFSRRVVLTGVSAAAARARQSPFFRADRVDVSLPASVWTGTLDGTGVRVEHARLSFVRRADGTTNLPEPRASAGEPARIPISSLDVRDLSIEFLDERQELSFNLSRVAIRADAESGDIRLDEPGYLRRRGVSTTIRRLTGGVAFDGRSVHLRGLEVATDELDALADGALRLIAAEPAVDLRVRGSGDVPALARWGTDATVPHGRIAFTGSVTGDLSRPAIEARVSSDALAWPAMEVREAACDLAFDGERVRARECTGRLLGGRLSAEAEAALHSERFAADIGWTHIDVAALAAATMPRASTRPAARASGTAAIRGAGAAIDGLSVDVRTRLAAAAPARRRVPVSGDARFRVADGRWRLEADNRVAGVPLQTSLAGRLGQPSLRASTIEGRASVPPTDVRPAVAALVNADLLDPGGRSVQAGTVMGDLTVSGTFARPRFRVHAAARDVHAYDAEGVSASAIAEGTFDRATVELRVAQGDAELEATGWLSLNARRTEGRVRGVVPDVSRFAGTAPAGGSLTLDVEARGPFDALLASGTATVADARYGDLALGRLETKLQADSRSVHMTVMSDELRARATAHVALDAARAATIDGTLEDASLERLTRGLGDAALEGRVSLTLHAEGPWIAWHQGAAAVEVSRLEGRSGELPFRLLAPARVSYRGGTVDVGSFDLQAGEAQFSLLGRIPAFAGAAAVPPGEALHATVLGGLPEIARTVSIAAGRGVPAIRGDGAMSLLVRVVGSLEEPALSADLELGPGDISIAELPPVSDLRVRARLEDGTVELVQLSGAWQQSRFNADGRVPLRLLEEHVPALARTTPSAAGARGSIRVTATSITPQVLAPFVDPESLAQIEGSVDASVRLDSDSLQLEHVQGDARIDRLDLRVAGVPIVQREPTRIVAENGFARVAAWEWTGQGAALTIDGQVRLADRMAALIVGAGIDLRMLSPFLRNAGATSAGSISARMSLTGPVSAPRFDGVATLAGGELRLTEPHILASGLAARAVLSGTRVHVSGITGVVNGGSVDGEGQLEYGEAFSAAFTTSVQHMALQFPEGLRSELSADLELTATDRPDGEPRGRVSGTVTILRSGYREPIAVITNLLAAVRTDRAVLPRTRTPSFADRLELDVRVLTDEDIVVDNNVARLQLGTDLRVIGTAGRPALAGRAELREGGQLFIGPNRYTIDAGTIEFANPLTIEPSFNVQAHTRAGSEDIELTIKGTTDAPDVNVRSLTTPELGSADVTSLLLTGRRLDDLSGAEAQVVGEQVAGYLSGDVLGLASRAVGLDTVRLGGVDQSLLRRDAANVATEADPTSRLTFGKSIRDNLEITFSQSLRNSAQIWILDYQPVRRMDLRLVSREDNLRTYEFRHDLSFGSAGARSTGTNARQRRAAARRVAAVSFRGDLAGAESRLRRALALRPGGEFTYADWQRDRDRLEALLRREGRLEARVGAERSETEDGLELVYRIDPGPLTAVTIEGYAPSPETERALEHAWEDAVSDEFLAEEAEAIVRRAAAREGYLWAEVVATLGIDGRKTLRITIVPGARATRRQIRVEVEDSSLAAALERGIRDAHLEDAAWQDPPTVREHLLNELRARGFLRARVRIAPPLLEDATAVLPIAVDTGPLFTVATAHAVTDMPTAGIPTTIEGVNAGDPYNPVAIDAARELLSRTLRRTGFVQARVQVDAAVDEASHRVAITFVVDAGPRQVLRAITVEGNRAIDADVVTRVLGLALDEPLGGDEWLAARARVFETGLFRRVDVRTEPLNGASDLEQPVRVVASVQEWPTLRIRYGVQVAEERPEQQVNGRDLVPGLSADVTRRTLFGRAVTLGGSTALQRRDRLGRLFLNAPTLFGWPVESLLSAQRGRESFADSTLLADRSGISWEQRVRLSRHLRVSYSYGFEHNHTFDSVASTDPFLPSLDVTVYVSRLTGSVVFDTRNDPTDATRGILLSSNLDYAPAALGTDVRFARYLAQAYRFQPWRRVVFASAARLGLAAGFDGQSVISSERFFAGGARTVRGVREDRLGPVDVLGDPAGGEAMIVLNQEVRFPVYRWVGGVGFVDAGQVFESPSAIALGRLVGSVGAGVRVSTPFALLRVDYARASSSAAERRPARWTFGIGHAF